MAEFQRRARRLGGVVPDTWRGGLRFRATGVARMETSLG